MAKALDMRVVAKGVENEEQRQNLQTLGVEEIQGYLISKPLTAKNIETFFSKNEMLIGGGNAGYDTF